MVICGRPRRGRRVGFLRFHNLVRHNFRHPERSEAKSRDLASIRKGLSASRLRRFGRDDGEGGYFQTGPQIRACVEKNRPAQAGRRVVNFRTDKIWTTRVQKIDPEWSTQPRRPGTSASQSEITVEAMATACSQDSGSCRISDAAHDRHDRDGDRGERGDLGGQQLHQGEPGGGAQRHRDGAGVERGGERLGRGPVRRQAVDQQRAQRDRRQADRRPARR